MELFKYNKTQFCRRAIDKNNEKKKFINNRINKAKDQKEMWRQIKNLILKRYQTAIESMIFNQIERKENLQIAETRCQIRNIPITYI